MNLTIYDFLDSLLGTENFSYIQLSYMILKDLGVKKEKIRDFIELRNLNGRFRVFHGINNSLLIDSSYNAGFESMKIMIDNTEKLRDELFPDYKIGYILGDMRELGKFSKELHEKLYEYIKYKDLLITVGKDLKKYFPSTVKNYLSSKQAGIYLKSFLVNSQDKYIILFKGSQNTIFLEEAIKQVLINQDDNKKMVRQEDYRINKKEEYFKTIK